MEIISITRKISGVNYDNISVTANVEKGEDLIAVATSIDAELRRMLNAINSQVEQVDEAKREKRETISLLQSALAYAKDIDIPF